MTAVGVGRIEVKTPRTKALGEAGTVVYGDLNAGREPNMHGRRGDRARSGRY